MPTLSANQVMPAGKQTATLTVRTTATAAQVAEPGTQAATLDLEHFPDVVLTAHQQLAPGTQSARLVTLPYKGPAVPRAERQPAKPR